MIEMKKRKNPKNVLTLTLAFLISQLRGPYLEIHNGNCLILLGKNDSFTQIRCNGQPLEK
jgi:hypothetical protein